MFQSTLFTTQCYARTVYAVIMRPSLWLSVRLSVNSWSFTKMAKPRITQTTLYDSPGTLVFQCQKAQQNSINFTRNWVSNYESMPQQILIQQNLQVLSWTHLAWCSAQRTADTNSASSSKHPKTFWTVIQASEIACVCLGPKYITQSSVTRKHRQTYQHADPRQQRPQAAQRRIGVWTTGDGY